MSEGQGLAFDFNLHSKCFIRYVFQQVDSVVPAGWPQEYVEKFKSVRKIDVRYIPNDLNALEVYKSMWFVSATVRFFAQPLNASVCEVALSHY